jgi:hypothetical protein
MLRDVAANALEGLAPPRSGRTARTKR